MKLLRILIFVLSAAAFSQAILKIHNADLLRQNPLGGRIIYGNVDIEYDIYRIKCDSAVINKDMTHARLFRNIQFSDTSRTIFCDDATLSETPGGRLAYLRGNVRILEGDLLISGKEASVNEMSEKITVTDHVTARYYKDPSILFCSELIYNTKDNIISSRSLDSVLFIDSLRYYRLYTDIFSYNTITKTLNLENRYRMRAQEFAEPLKDHRSTDPDNIHNVSRTLEIIKEAFFSAGRGTFSFDPLEINTLGKCSFTRTDPAKNDTVFFDADRMAYSEKQKEGTAEGSVIIRNGALRIKSEKARYFIDEKIVKFNYDPVITYDLHKITGDSVRLLIGEEEFFPEEGTIYGNPVYTSVPDEKFPLEKNVLKGRLMDLWFLNREISKIVVSKEAEGLYFIRGDGKKESEASNYLLGDALTIVFRDGEIERAVIEGGSEGIYFPGKLKHDALKKIRK